MSVKSLKAPPIRMPIDYKKELEDAAKSMIMVHDPKLLIKLIVRMIVGKLQIRHAGMILYDSDQDIYVLNISRGEVGFKVPAGFAKFSKDNPLIKLFLHKEYKALTTNRNAIIMEDLNKLIWKESVITGLDSNGNGNGMKELLHAVDEQMQMLNAVACVPAYYQHRLLAVLLLGSKNDGSKFEQYELNFFAALASDAAMAIRNAQLFADLRKEAERNHNLFLQTMLVLGSAIEAKDKYTKGHTERVTNYSMQIAHQMKLNGSYQFPENFFENLQISGLLHDIGKIGVPEGILTKVDKLTPEEYEIMKLHTTQGYEIISPLPLAKECFDGVKYHHERYDGKGYPEKLKGEEIPIVAAIIGVADAYDAMTTDRPYRKGTIKQVAIEEIRKNIGTQFHPLPTKALLELFEMGRI